MPDDKSWAARMRTDWDQRARSDAERYIYTRDSESDVAEFDRSGLANYNQLVRPFLPLLLDGKPSRDCRVLEIGCGAGRMTQWFAGAFGEVHGVDVSPEMIRLARRRLRHARNVELSVGDGVSLRPLPDRYFDLVFSYIVFQHIPSREIITGYVREAARVLKDGGAFKFQVGGVSQSTSAEAADTWHGVSLSFEEAREMLAGTGFELISAEGAGTQLFVITAVKGPGGSRHPRQCILPGEDPAGEMLLDGWGAAVDRSWRPVECSFSFMIDVNRGEAGLVYLGLYIWPGDGSRCRRIEVKAGGKPAGRAEFHGEGDHYFEFPLPAGVVSGSLKIDVELQPGFARQPACRVAGWRRAS